jgi:1-acyl-sn-glycerol-3-phosphate acyltransferase
MIAANKQGLFNAWFAGHTRSRIRRTFQRMSVSGLERTRRIAAGAPLLVVSNHTSWWDPLVILHASQHLLGTDGHALMDAKNLRRLPFFALSGAFGVDLESPMDGAVVMKYAARLLDRPGRLVWVFPQGVERPVTERPLRFRAGAAAIARVAQRAVTVPAALRYEFAGTERPVLYLSFGSPLAAERDPDVGRVAQESAVEAELARIERAVCGELELDFADVFPGDRTPGMELATKALAVLTARATSVRR